MGFLTDVKKRAKNAQRRMAASEPVPKSRDEAARSLSTMGTLRREMNALEAQMEAQIADIREEYEQAALPHLQKFDGLKETLVIYAEAHRDELTDGGKRQSIDLGSGELKWRKLPPSVRLRKVDDVLAAIHQMEEDDKDYSAFIRSKEEVNKEAMLANTDKASLVPGVSIGSAGETIDVVPLVEELSAAKQMRKTPKQKAA